MTDAERLRALHRARGGVAVFPADTVYGLACAPDSEAAVRRLYELKGRPPEKPAAVMFFALEPALAALPELGPRTRRLLERAAARRGHRAAAQPARAASRWPAARTPRRSACACPRCPPSPACACRCLQSSANRSGGPEARRLHDVPAPIRDGADLVLDGGELPGTPSTVVDLRGFEDAGEWRIVRAGAVPEQRIAQASRFS